MVNHTQAKMARSKKYRPFQRHRRCKTAHGEAFHNNSALPSMLVGRNLRDLRTDRGLSIRALADLSNLNVNTLSSIENNKTSPSVSTLQLLANAMDIPITAFFEIDTLNRKISYQIQGQRLKVAFANGTLEDLGEGLTLQGEQPFLVTLEPKANSGITPLVHTGIELVYCLEGHLSYTIGQGVYPLDPGDSLLFEACLPHCWRNAGTTASRSLLIVCTSSETNHRFGIISSWSNLYA
jgi:transcriptional regulator with XRE-family HTH domain